MAEASLPEQEIVAPEARTSRLSQHVMRAEFGSFQEYFYIVTKENGRFEVQDKRWESEKGDSETDLVSIPYPDPAELVYALEGYFNLPPRRDRNSPSMSYGDLYCVYGEKNGKFIFQGAGIIHRDRSGRQNYNSLKLVFDSREPLEEFVQWMEEQPAEALAGVTKEIYPVVSERVYTPRRWIGKLTVANVNTGQVKAKTSERPVLDQDVINVIESQLRMYGSIDAVKEHYQQLEKEEPRFQEDARAMLRGIDAYKREFLSKPAS